MVRPIFSLSITLKLFVVLMGVLTIHSTAIAQPDNPTRRIALIIGNSDYNLDGRIDPRERPALGMFRDIPSACADAQAFASSLRNAGWTNSEIIGGARCNLSASEMTTAINGVVEELSTPEPGESIFAVIYFGGHGAQFGQGSDQRQFLFGAGATIDLDGIVRGLTTIPGNIGFVANQAVDLTGVLTVVGDQGGPNALWIISDACRNDLLYDELEQELPALSISALSSRTVRYGGVVVTYSTTGEAFASEPLNSGSVFAATLREMLAPRAPLDSVLNGLPARVKAAYGQLHSIGSQHPWSDGRFGHDWCVWECAPGTLNAVPPPRSTARSTEVSHPMELASTVDPGMPKGMANPSLRKHSTQANAQSGSANAREMPDRVVFDRFAGDSSHALQARGVRVDVFWCDELPGAEDRFSRATAIAEHLGEVARGDGSGTADDPSRLNSIRVRHLSLETNLFADYRYSGDFVIIDADNRGEAGVADLITAANPSELSTRRDGQTPDYVSVVICRSTAPTVARPRLFLQVPTDALLGFGRELTGLLRRAFPRGEVSRDIEVVPGSPNNTLVRFYHPEDRDVVFQIAARLETQLGAPIRIDYSTEYSPLPRPGVIEVWLGKQQRAAPTPKR